MSVKLTRIVLNHASPHIPKHWRPVLIVLAFTAKRDDGSGIWIGAATIADYLGWHRVTVSRILAEMTAAGLLRTIKRGGRRRTAKGRTIGRHTERVLDARAIETYHPSTAAFG